MRGTKSQKPTFLGLQDSKQLRWIESFRPKKVGFWLFLPRINFFSFQSRSKRYYIYNLHVCFVMSIYLSVFTIWKATWHGLTFVMDLLIPKRDLDVLWWKGSVAERTLFCATKSKRVLSRTWPRLVICKPVFYFFKLFAFIMCIFQSPPNARSPPIFVRWY